jgi:hypothetical protein
MKAQKKAKVMHLGVGAQGRKQGQGDAMLRSLVGSGASVALV